jgi:hypothetical protein
MDVSYRVSDTYLKVIIYRYIGLNVRWIRISIGTFSDTCLVL